MTVKGDASGTTVAGTLTATTLAGTLSTAAQTNITSLGTLTALTVDDITINGSTISDAADLTLDVGGDLFLDADGGQVYFQDGGVLHGSIDMTSGLILRNHVSDADVFIQGNDGGSNINMLTFDTSNAGDATFNRSVTTGGNLAVTGQGDFSTQIMVGTNNTTLSENNFMFNPAGHFYIDHMTTGQDIIFRTSNSSSRDETALTLSTGGNTTVHGHLYVTDGSVSAPAITFSNDNDTGIIRVTTNALGLVAAGSRKFYVNATNAYYQNLTRVQIDSGDLHVGMTGYNFTDSVSNTHTKYIEIGANGSTSLGDALLVTHSAGSGVGYFGYESGNDRLIIACDNGGGNNTIEFSVNAGTATGGTTDNLNGATAALTIGGDEVVTTAKHVRQSGAPGFKVKNHGFTKGTGWTHIGASITTVDYNNNSSGWSSSNGRFTPTRAGYYLFSFGGWANASTNGARYATSFAKNNSLTYISGGDYCSVDSPLNGHSEVIYMNGSTDYVQLYAYSAISCTWGTTSHAAWWSAMWLH